MSEKSYAVREREAVCAVAVATLQDPTAAPEDRAAAKHRLTNPERDYRQVSDAELEVALYVARRASGIEPSADDLTDLCLAAATLLGQLHGRLERARGQVATACPLCSGPITLPPLPEAP